jgi:uncharacterized protein YdeI (YjbR/CyaY-like superfamily)
MPAATPSPSRDLPELVARDASTWRKWLARHHATSPGVWLVVAKKGTIKPTRLGYAEALEEALCHGWIDGQGLRRDDATYKIRFTPRRKRSAWSKRNTVIVERLTKEGRMHASGIAEVERAKADGRWQAAYPGQRAAEMPADLAAALNANSKAKAMFSVLSAQNRFAILYRIHSAKRRETRVRRTEQFVDMLAKGETPYPQRKAQA